jgi:hypothetical protein
MFQKSCFHSVNNLPEQELIVEMLKPLWIVLTK